MDQSAIFGPVLATVLLTLAVWVYLYARRIPFLQASGVDPQDLRGPGALDRISPPSVRYPSDNLKNLFEIPVLFYVLAFYVFVTGQVDAGYVWAGWVFAWFRVLHSAVHCTINVVMLRFVLYLVSTLAVFYMAIRAVLHAAPG
jgi:hypothetical protein